jgi:hypothetical protein
MNVCEKPPAMVAFRLLIFSYFYILILVSCFSVMARVVVRTHIDICFGDRFHHPRDDILILSYPRTRFWHYFFVAMLFNLINLNYGEKFILKNNFIKK